MNISFVKSSYFLLEKKKLKIIQHVGASLRKLSVHFSWSGQLTYQILLQRQSRYLLQTLAHNCSQFIIYLLFQFGNFYKWFFLITPMGFKNDENPRFDKYQIFPVLPLPLLSLQNWILQFLRISLTFFFI